MKVSIQEKFTLPIACLVFSLIGSSLACTSNTKANQSKGFVLSILLIIIYYIVSFVFNSLGILGYISPVFAAWFPVIGSLSGGIYLLNNADN